MGVYIARVHSFQYYCILDSALQHAVLLLFFHIICKNQLTLFEVDSIEKKRQYQ